jgi:hypothetical protein
MGWPELCVEAVPGRKPCLEAPTENKLSSNTLAERTRKGFELLQLPRQQA